MTEAEAGSKQGLATFGAALQQILDAAGMSQGEMARNTGIPQPTLSQLIRGQYRPTWRRVESLLATVAELRGVTESDVANLHDTYQILGDDLGTKEGADMDVHEIRAEQMQQRRENLVGMLFFSPRPAKGELQKLAMAPEYEVELAIEIVDFILRPAPRTARTPTEQICEAFLANPQVQPRDISRLGLPANGASNVLAILRILAKQQPDKVWPSRQPANGGTEPEQATGSGHPAALSDSNEGEPPAGAPPVQNATRVEATTLPPAPTAASGPAGTLTAAATEVPVQRTPSGNAVPGLLAALRAEFDRQEERARKLMSDVTKVALEHNTIASERDALVEERSALRKQVTSQAAEIASLRTQIQQSQQGARDREYVLGMVVQANRRADEAEQLAASLTQELGDAKVETSMYIERNEHLEDENRQLREKLAAWHRERNH